MMPLGRRRVLLFAAMLAATALAGCETPGQSGRDAELARQRSGGDFAVIDATPARAVFTARGQRIIVEPPSGYCLDLGSVAATRNAAFALVADCLSVPGADLAQTAGAGKVVEIALPRVFPGILTVSVSGEPAYGRKPGALDAFEALLQAETGLKLLGRGNGPAPGNIVATRRIGGALYVLIEESSAGAASILAPRFWRAFIEINERLVLVTVSSFSDRPVAEDAMMGFLALQMTGLRRVNRLRAEEEEDKIAADMAASFDLADAQGGLTLVHSESAALIPAPAPAAASAVILGGSDPMRAPVPLQRMASAGAVAPRRSAPARAPVAPHRPG